MTPTHEAQRRLVAAEGLSERRREMLTDAKRAEISARVAARLARAGLRPPLKPKLVVDNPVVRASTDDHNRAGATRIRSVESLRRHEPQVMRNPYALDGVASGRAFGARPIFQLAPPRVEPP
jgi:hypothetical protein